MSDFDAFSHGEDFPVSAEWFHELAPLIVARARYRELVTGPDGRSATAIRDTQQQGALVKRETVQAVLRWRQITDGVTRVEWDVFDFSIGQRGSVHTRAGKEFGQAIRFVVYGAPEAAPVPHDLVIGPGEPFDGRFSGNLRDYSFCSISSDVADFECGKLPLGVYAFTRGGDTVLGKPLYLGGDSTGAPILYKGVLVCAPQNSGKTKLILRWAKAANLARYNQLIIDVKGNLLAKLSAANWRGPIYYLTTAPNQRQDEPESDRINFLAGYIEEPDGIRAETTDRLRQLVTALLPSEGWTESGGKDEFFYRNRVIWLTALVHILLLRQIYRPWSFKDCRLVSAECRRDGSQRSRDFCRAGVCVRTADLGDLYELTVSESWLCEVIAQLRVDEAAARAKPNVSMPECGVDYWVRELALLLDAKAMPGDGQRPENESFQQYTAGLKQALEPFARHGTLHRRVKDNGPGRLFRLEDLGVGPPEEPVTIVIAARDQDQINAETLLSLVITRLQHLLFDRMPLRNPRPILLLLDETRRIRGFEANRYITFAREAKAGCVIVYQSLEQIGDDKKIAEILENIGTQIYLGSLVGSTANHFINSLPKRYRAAHAETVQRTASGIIRNENIGHELIDCFTTNDLYSLPAGEYPALVLVADQPRRRPILVSMDERILPEATIILPVRLIGHHQCIITDLVVWPNGGYLLAAGAADILVGFDIEAGLTVIKRGPDDSGGQCAAISLLGDLYATGCTDGRIHLLDTTSATLVRTIEAHTSAVRAIVFTRDGSELVSVSDDGQLTVHDVASGSPLKVFDLLGGAGTGLAISADGLRVVAVAACGSLHFFSTLDWSTAAKVNLMTPVASLAASANFDTIILGTPTGALLWREEAETVSLSGSHAAPYTVSAVPAGGVLAVGFDDGTIQIWIGETLELAATLNLNAGSVTMLAASADGRAIFAGCENLGVYRIDLEPLFM
jgi:hypothetical protein